MLKQRLRDFFLGEIPETELEIWFDPLLFQQDKNNLQVRFPHRLFFEWFDANYRSSFEKKLNKFAASNLIPVYCDHSGLCWPGDKLKTKKNTSYRLFTNKQSLEKTDEAVAVQSFAKTFSQTFENFLYNRKNEFPLSAAREFAKLEGPGQLAFYAAPGYGKSHILTAIFQEMRTYIHENSIFFGKLEELETIIENNKGKGNPFFLPFCDLKALIIDNFQECAGKPEFQKNLVKLLEQCSEQKIYLALSVDASPAACPYLSGRLRSLLESGLIIEIKKPDLDIKTRYIQGQNDKLGLHLKKEEILYLARLYSEFRQIHGTMLKVWSFKSLKPSDTDFVLSDILKNSGVSGAVSLTPELVLNCVAEHMNLAAAGLRGKERSRQVVLARQLTMYLLRELLPVNLSLIGEFMGLNHSSVVYSINKVKEMIKTNRDINKLVTNLRNMCLTKNRRGSFVA
ncbi:MAG: hypothetical protein LBM64_04045 [Deltaproteobacteria bacterium]|jgi:chromosomal replication initiator protein|nr:hypothetical protein [Deltaproteobacteria bacterium]